MLKIVIDSDDGWDEVLEEFVPINDPIEFQIEHSLVSISKWESKWQKPWLSSSEKTPEEILDYIKCMTITPDVPEEAYSRLTQQIVNDIVRYIDSPMTATTFSNTPTSSGRMEVITSELIYYSMIMFNIPKECETWHLNRLLTLIRVCSIKSQPSEKKSPREVMEENRRLNELRRKQYNSRG